MDTDKFYGVAVGRVPGVYASWDEARAQVEAFKGAKHKSFMNAFAAERWVAEHSILVATCDVVDDTTNMSTLDKQQALVVEAFDRGENIFITGPAGCGKTYLIKTLIARSRKNVCVTAMTGCAALLLLEHKAKTLNSWGGIGIANKDNQEIIESIVKNKTKRNNWKKTDVLIVDEVSMMSRRIFDLLDSIGRIIRKCDKAFGGIQLVFSGDFFQLPPVSDGKFEGSAKFCFESSLWDATFGHQIELKTVYRQEDPTFKKILNQIRKGKISTESCKILNDCVSKSKESDIMPVKLHPRRQVVDSINQGYNECLETESREYAGDAYEVTKAGQHDKVTDKEVLTKLLGNSSLKLKIGSQVMSTSNIDMHGKLQICNGSCGVVINFTRENNPIVRFHNGRKMEIETVNNEVEFNNKVYDVETIPLILAWALTIHKIQGATLDIAEIDIGSSVFECGQTYVALSRVKTLKGLYLTSFDPTKIKVKSSVKKFYEKLREKN